MGETEISWTHRPGTVGRSWNPTQGCALESEGCRNCYAMRMAARFAESGWSNGLINLKTRKWNGEARLAAHKLSDPLRWRDPSTVFVNSMSDLFYEGFSNEVIDQVFAVMLLSPRHTYQILTKRARRMREYMTDPSLYERVLKAASIVRDERPELNEVGIANPASSPARWIWLGVSVENQEAADDRIPELLATPAAVRFLSCEPLLGPVDLTSVRPRPLPINALTGGWAVPCQTVGYRQEPRLHWIIAGAESGPRSRACDVAWLRSLRDQCGDAGVPYFLKQAHSGPGIGMHPGSKRKAGDIYELPALDEKQHAAFPEVADAGSL